MVSRIEKPTTAHLLYHVTQQQLCPTRDHSRSQWAGMIAGQSNQVRDPVTILPRRGSKRGAGMGLRNMRYHLPLTTYHLPVPIYRLPSIPYLIDQET